LRSPESRRNGSADDGGTATEGAGAFIPRDSIRRPHHMENPQPVSPLRVRDDVA